MEMSLIVTFEAEKLDQEVILELINRIGFTAASNKYKIKDIRPAAIVDDGKQDRIVRDILLVALVHKLGGTVHLTKEEIAIGKISVNIDMDEETKDCTIKITPSPDFGGFFPQS